MKVTGTRGPGGVYKIDKDGEEFNFKSVTTILSKLKDPEVAGLLAEIGKEQFDKISQNAADRGSVMHMYMENYAKYLMKTGDREKSLEYTQKKTPIDFKDTDPKIFEKGRNLFYNLYHSEFMDEFYKPLMIEGLMVSFKYKYAGRTDIIYVNNDMEIILGDYKSSSKILEYSSNKVVKYKMQLAAYINAFEEMYNKEIKQGIVWVSSAQGWQKFVLTKYEYPIYLEYFKLLIAA